MSSFTKFKRIVWFSLLVGLAGCNTTKQPPPSQPQPQVKPQPAKPIETPNGVIITPYEQEEIKRKNMRVIVPERKNTLPAPESSPPAFQQLMLKTQQAYQAEKWAEAEQYALQAQRISPQAAETYLYLALIANQKQQYANAEALANRGLSFARTHALKKQLWMVILKSGQARQLPSTIHRAQAALRQL